MRLLAVLSAITLAIGCSAIGCGAQQPDRPTGLPAGASAPSTDAVVATSTSANLVTASPSASSAAEPPTVASATSKPETPKASALPPPLPKGTTVLHVGDSMADALGKSLKRELEKRGIKNVLEAKEATYIPEWAGFKMELSLHIARRKPDLVIVTLGGNEVKMPDPTVRVDAIKRLVAKIGDRPCLWVAAPLWPGLTTTGILDVIRDNCAPCIYVDTNELIPDLKRLKDKVHPTIPERRRWAKFMVRWLLQNRNPAGQRPWDFKAQQQAPPTDSEGWLDTR
ncbi:MAG: hypothetical protein DRI90_00485 [Deltaproteobacteria bacterium]|nr:MAG: hypothetical protein DRI90_00485 [Deltaproteobacteria bacterium]